MVNTFKLVYKIKAIKNPNMRISRSNQNFRWILWGKLYKNESDDQYANHKFHQSWTNSQGKYYKEVKKLKEFEG